MSNHFAIPQKVTNWFEHTTSLYFCVCVRVCVCFLCVYLAHTHTQTFPLYSFSLSLIMCVSLYFSRLFLSLILSLSLNLYLLPSPSLSLAHIPSVTQETREGGGNRLQANPYFLRYFFSKKNCFSSGSCGRVCCFFLVFSIDFFDVLTFLMLPSFFCSIRIFPKMWKIVRVTVLYELYVVKFRCMKKRKKKSYLRIFLTCFDVSDEIGNLIDVPAVDIVFWRHWRIKGEHINDVIIVLIKVTQRQVKRVLVTLPLCFGYYVVFIVVVGRPFLWGQGREGLTAREGTTHRGKVGGHGVWLCG